MLVSFPGLETVRYGASRPTRPPTQTRIYASADGARWQASVVSVAVLSEREVKL